MKKMIRNIYNTIKACIPLGVITLFASFTINNDPKETILKKIIPPKFPFKEIRISGPNNSNWKKAFDDAMTESKTKKGARIIVPKGIYYLNGPIHFASNTELHLEEGATLIFSSDPKNYLPVVKTTWEGTFLYNYSPFIYGYQLKNIAITGKGTIKAENPELWASWRDKQKQAQEESRRMNHESVPVEKRIFGEGHFLRPQLIQFYECENILIENIRIEDSPFWCIHLVLSKNITARGIQFNAHNLNNDGIDPEFSRDVLIENIAFNNGDDNIAIKAGRDHDGRALHGHSSHNIVIRNCKFQGLHGVVIGSEMSAGVHDVYVENCSYAGKLKRGIYLKSNADRGGKISHIFVNNVSLGEVEDLIMITSKYKNEGQGFHTAIHDIHLKNIQCKKATGHGILVEGFPTKKVHNLYISNIKVDTVHIPMNVMNTERIHMSNITFGQVDTTAIKK